MNTKINSSRIRFLAHGLVAALALCGAWRVAAADGNGQLDRKETSFIKEAAQDGQAEVQLGQLAAEKAQSPEIKRLGQRLEQDHTKGNQELMQIAQKDGVTVSTEPSRKEERTADRLQDKTGAQFDKTFAEHAIKDHVKDIEKYQKALQNTRNPDLRAYIEKNIPVLEEHLQMARTAGATVGVDQNVLASADRILANRTGQGLGTSGTSQTGRGAQSITTDRNDSQSAPERNQSQNPK